MENPLDLLRAHIEDKYEFRLADAALQEIVNISAEIIVMQDYIEKEDGENNAFECRQCQSMTGFDCICEDEESSLGYFEYDFDNDMESFTSTYGRGASKK